MHLTNILKIYTYDRFRLDLNPWGPARKSALSVSKVPTSLGQLLQSCLFRFNTLLMWTNKSMKAWIFLLFKADLWAIQLDLTETVWAMPPFSLLLTKSTQTSRVKQALEMVVFLQSAENYDQSNRYPALLGKYVINLGE